METTKTDMASTGKRYFWQRKARQHVGQAFPFEPQTNSRIRPHACRAHIAGHWKLPTVVRDMAKVKRATRWGSYVALLLCTCIVGNLLSFEMVLHPFGRVAQTTVEYETEILLAERTFEHEGGLWTAWGWVEEKLCWEMTGRWCRDLGVLQTDEKWLG